MFLNPVGPPPHHHHHLPPAPPPPLHPHLQSHERGKMQKQLQRETEERIKRMKEEKTESRKVIPLLHEAPPGTRHMPQPQGEEDPSQSPGTLMSPPEGQIKYATSWCD